MRFSSILLLGYLFLLSGLHAQNTSTEPQYIEADTHFKEPITYVDVTRYHVRGGNASTTATTTNRSRIVTLAAASTFQNSDGVTIYGAGPTNRMSTPRAPTVTTNLARVMTGTGDVTATGLTGATTYNYKIIARDIGGGFTAASAAGSVTTGPSSLGSQSVSVTSCNRSNTTATCVTGSAHGLVVGAMVIISGFIGSDTSFNGWYQVSASADNTHFQFTSGQDTRNGAPTATTTSATVFWFNCNHITWSAVTGAYQYYIYTDRGNPGTFSLIGASWPVNGSFTDGTLAFDDFGSPMMDGFTAKPASIPTTAPVSAANDYLTTTIVSGAGTTTLTLAANAGQSISGVTILYDDAPNLITAATAAAGKPLYLLGQPPTVNSPLNFAGLPTQNLPAMIGSMTLNDVMTLTTTSKWIGQAYPTKSSASTFQFQSTLQVPCNVSPCVHIVQNTTDLISHLQFNGKGNGQTMMVADAGGGSAFGEFDYDYFQSGTSNDYMNIGLVVRGWSGFLSGGTRMRGINFTASQLANASTATPMFYCDACSDVTIESIFYSGRAALLRADNAGSSTVMYRGYIQGNPGAFMVITGSNTIGGNTGLTLDMNRVQLDTTFQPALVYLPSLGTLSATVRLFSVPQPQLGTPQVTGNALTALTGASGVSQNTAMITGSNFTDNVTGVVGSGELGTLFPPAAAPSVAVVAGTNNPVQTINVGITWVDAAGRISGFAGTGPTGVLISGLGRTTPVVLTSGNQNFNVTPPTPPAGAIGYYMWSSAGTGPWTVGSGSCGTALVTPANGTANDVRIGNCGLHASGGAGFASLTSSGLTGYQLILGGGSAKDTISGSFTANRRQTLQDTADTFVYRNTADTLSHKTLTAPTISSLSTSSNCNVNSASPAACGSAPNGVVVAPSTTTTYTVDSTAVTANSRIIIMPITDNSGVSGSPKCNAPAMPFIGYESGRVAGTSFTFTLPSTTGTSCWVYWIVN